jgi:hypothetical protein
MASLRLVLMVFAFVCALLAAVGIPAPPPRFNLLAAAIAFWIAATLFG